MILNRVKDYYENDEERFKKYVRDKYRNFSEKKKKKENMEKTDTIICLKKKNKD